MPPPLVASYEASRNSYDDKGVDLPLNDQGVHLDDHWGKDRSLMYREKTMGSLGEDTWNFDFFATYCARKDCAPMEDIGSVLDLDSLDFVDAHGLDVLAEHKNYYLGNNENGVLDRKAEK